MQVEFWTNLPFFIFVTVDWCNWTLFHLCVAPIWMDQKYCFQSFEKFCYCVLVEITLGGIFCVQSVFLI